MSRPYDAVLKDLIKKIQIYQFGFLAMGVAIVILAIANLLSFNKKPQIIVVDTHGKSSWSSDPNMDTWKNMAVFDVKEFIEDLHNFDAVSIINARSAALNKFVPTLRDRLKSTVVDTAILFSVTASGTQSLVSYDIPPRIIEWNYPSCRIFSAFVVTVIDREGHKTTKKNHLTVQGSFFGSTPANPSGFYVTGYSYITDETQLNKILNVIGGGK